MPIFRAGVTVGLLMIGAIMALLGFILLFSALPSGEIQLSRSGEAGGVTEIISRTKDAARYWQYLSGLGIVPLVLGAVLTRWAWRQIKTGGN